MNDQEEYLISYSNLKSGLFKYQNDFLDSKMLLNFYKNPSYGVPLCLPANIKYFDYSNAIYFKIDKKKFSKEIFKTKKLNYVGNVKYFRYGNLFASNIKIKKEYFGQLQKYQLKTKKLKKKIKSLLKKEKKVCAMQIRNVPHFGHEAIFKFLIKKFNLLILNPIFGIKKKNDFSDNLISKALRFMENKYKKKIIFLPIWSNFHYAGPREAVHHMNLRESLGFNYFYIGRDHAGAQNLYKLNDATKLVKKNKLNFNINSVTSSGGYYCQKCQDYLIRGTCKHRKLINISGTEFRKKLFNRLTYIHADKKLQIKLIKYL